MNKMPIKKCLECEDSFEGRVDKKFCSDQCRNTYNNRLNSDASNLVRNTNRILKKNRRILEELNADGTTKVAKEKMLRKGFKFDYITSYYTTKKGDTYYYCYDQGYIQTGEKYFTIVKRKEYLDD